MAQLKNKSPKRLPREMVAPFIGEENFVVPKRGGFGQPDMEDYVMVAGSGSVAVPDAPSESPSSSGTSTSTSTPVAPVGTQVGTTPPTTTDPSTQADAPVTTPPPSTTTPPVTSDEKTQAQIDCESAGGVYLNGVCNVATRTDLVFPDFSKLDCATLKFQIDSINSTLATSKFSVEITEQYIRALASAKSNYDTKCPTAPPTNTTPTPVIPVLPIGGFGGGFGGGGGFGEPPAEGGVVEEPKKSNAGLIIILVGIGVLYYLTRKRN
jgi:hypothetical protein